MNRPRLRPTARPAAAAAELAIALPFLVLVFAVALDFCRVYHTSQTLQTSAFSAALYASGYAKAAPANTPSGGTAPSPTQLRTDAARKAAVAEGVSLDPPVRESDVQVAFANGQATVTVTYNCTLLTPALGGSRVLTLTRQAAVRQVPDPGAGSPGAPGGAAPRSARGGSEED